MVISGVRFNTTVRSARTVKSRHNSSSPKERLHNEITEWKQWIVDRSKDPSTLKGFLSDKMINKDFSLNKTQLSSKLTDYRAQTQRLESEKLEDCTEIYDTLNAIEAIINKM